MDSFNTVFREMKIEDYVSALSGREPVPGGGGTASLAAALASALGHMVGSLTVGKKKYAAVEEDVRALMARSDKVTEKLLALMDEDAKAFLPLSKAYSLPKETPEEQAEKDRVMEECLLGAAGVPLAMMRTCREVTDLLAEYVEKGSVLAVSDAGCGAALISAAVRCAALNVAINTKYMKDRAKAQEMDAECAALVEELTGAADALYADVAARLAAKKG